MVYDAIRRSGENSVIIFKALFEWFDVNAYIATKVIAPIEELAIYGLLAKYADSPLKVSYVVVGNAIIQAAVGGLATAGTVSEDRGLGMLGILIASPVNRLANFLQRGAVHIADALLSVVVAFVFAALIFHISFASADYLALCLSVLVAALASIALGLLLGAVSIAYGDFFLVHTLIFMLLLLLAGVNIPVSQLPGWVQPISLVLPFTRSIQAARMALDGASLGAVAPRLAVELALGVAYVAIGYWFLRLVERLAISRGSLERES
jgi:ABC-2 type transport system permease protein